MANMDYTLSKLDLDRFNDDVYRPLTCRGFKSVVTYVNVPFPLFENEVMKNIFPTSTRRVIVNICCCTKK